MSKPMRAKVRVASVVPDSYNDVLKIHGVYGGSTNAEDNTFASATPGLNLEIYISNPALRGVYKAGDEFYMDFTPIPKA